MNSQNEVTNAVTTTEVSRAEGARQMFDTIETLRQRIPVFSFPVIPGNGRKLSFSKDVPAEFMEQTNAALTEQEALERKGADPEQLRDLASYAIAYGPVADAMERLAGELRHSVNSAKAKAGAEALITYTIAQRLAKRPETAHLASLVQDLRRTLGVTRKRQAAKQKAKKGNPPATPDPQHPPLAQTSEPEQP